MCVGKISSEQNALVGVQTTDLLGKLQNFSVEVQKSDKEIKEDALAYMTQLTKYSLNWMDQLAQNFKSSAFYK